MLPVDVNGVELPVYPCVYREHGTGATTEQKRDDLPLCVQGTLCYQTHCQMSTRFTPVCTGNILVIYFVKLFLGGLPLCVQGTLQEKSTALAKARFTPVCTGNMMVL